MSEAPTNAVPSVASRSSRWRPLAWLLLVLALLIAGAIGGWMLYGDRLSIPPPPTPDLQGVDPAVADILERERQEVLRQPRSAAAWGRFGEALELFNFRNDAAVCFAQAERLDPREPRWPYHRGLVLLWDNAEQAIPPLRRAAELCGDDPDFPRLRLSETLLSQGHLEEAEQGFRHLLQRDALGPRVNLGLGRLEMRRQHWREALAHLRRAAADPRTHRSAALALVELHQRLGETDTAEQYRLQAERLPPDPDLPDPFMAEIQKFNVGKRIRMMRADQYFKQGRASEALAMYDRVTRDYPEAEDGWLALGQALYHVRDFAAAEQALQRTVGLKPGFAEAHNYLGLARLKQGKLKEAAASFRKAIELKADFAPAYSNLGRCLLRQNDSAGALDAFRAAVRYKPDYTAAYVELAELLHQSHQDDEAREQIRLALQIDPSDERAKQWREKLRKK